MDGILGPPTDSYRKRPIIQLLCEWIKCTYGQIPIGIVIKGLKKCAVHMGVSAIKFGTLMMIRLIQMATAAMKHNCKYIFQFF
jgi:hypothetical protein